MSRSTILCAAFFEIAFTTSAMCATPRIKPPAALTTQEMSVPDALSLEDKVKKHLVILEKTIAIREWAQKEKALTLARNGRAKDYAAYEEEYLNSLRVLLPYAIGNDQAQVFIKQGYAIDF